MSQNLHINMEGFCRASYMHMNNANQGSAQNGGLELTSIVTGFAKTVPNGTRIEIPFIAWHES